MASFQSNGHAQTLNLVPGQSSDKVNKPSVVLEKNPSHLCMYHGCSFSPAPTSMRPAHTLQNHIRQEHQFDPKPCEHGCDPDKLYYEESKYKYDISSRHSDRWPAPCEYQGCTRGGTFANLHSIKYHLTTAHDLDEESIGPYLPALPARKTWVPQACHYKGCTKSFTKRDAQLKHLQKAHSLISLEAARQHLEEEGEFEMVVPEYKPRKKRAAPSGLGEQTPQHTRPKSKRGRA